MSKFTTSIEDFLAHKEENSEALRTVETYRRKIDIFAEYLIVKRNVDDTNYNLVLKSLEPEQVLESIDYYVGKYGIKYKSTVDTYFTVIREYFKFIRSEYNIINEDFETNHRTASLKDKVGEKIKELKLNLTKQSEPLSKAECEKLIDICNEKISIVSDSQVIKSGNNSDYSLFVSAIIIKLLLYTGMKINTLTALNISDFDTDLNKLKINGYWIHLPDDLTLQLKRYAKIRQILLPNDQSCPKLFFNRNNPKVPPTNAKMFEVLKSVVSHKKSIAISKYTIVEMIKVNIPSYVIMEFTGYKDDVYDHCLEVASQEMDEFKDRDLDAKMRSLALFDML